MPDLEFIYHHRTQGRGGEGVHVASLIRALEEAGHHVTLVSPPRVDPLRNAGEAPVDKSNQRSTGVQRLWKWISRWSPQFLFEVFELGYNVYAWVRLTRALSQRSFTVYYERYAFFLLAGVVVAKRRGLPVILEVNEVAGVPRARGLVFRRIAQAIERSVFRRADVVLPVSSFLAEEARRRGAKRVCVLPNAVDPAAFRPVDATEKFREQLGLAGKTVVGFVGWFDRWDRLDLLITAVATLAHKHRDLRLILVGDGPVARDLRIRIRREGLQDLVQLTGAVPRTEIPRHLAAMDIGVLPYSNEFGSPIALFEMLATGRPVVVPDLAPIRDVIEDGETGLIVPPGDATALREAIDRLVADPELRRTLGARARERALTHHTWGANAARVASVARELSGKG